MRNLKANLLELIRRTSAELPEDVVRRRSRRQGGAAGQHAPYAMTIIGQNIDLAKLKSAPLCQDTGSILFFVKAPKGFDQLAFEKAARAAVAEATAKGYLRQNSVDSLTGKNTGNNLGPGSPSFHFHQHRGTRLDVRLILKGGGCENVGAQYSLPTRASARTATWTACARPSWTPCSRPRGRAAARASWGSASGATGRRGTSTPRSSSSARWTT